MSFYNTTSAPAPEKLTEAQVMQIALAAMPPTPKQVIEARSLDWDDVDFGHFVPLLSDGICQALISYEGGSNTFMKNLRYQLTAKGGLTPRQLRAAANIFRRFVRGEGTLSPNYADREYKCFQCGEVLVGKQALYDHKPVCSMGNGVGLAAPSQPVLPDFKPTRNINLRAFPAGRFAVEMADGSVKFIIITKLKRRTRIRGRFRWTKYPNGNMPMEAGDRTVREQIGDTKKLIGVQRMSQDFYHGEDEEVLEAISQAPAKAMTRYGVEMQKCAYCGRSLTDPESRLRGIGPDCWEHKHIPFLRRGVTQ